MWKVEVRDNCKMCGAPLPNARHRTFCSTKCRNKSNNAKQKGYGVAWQRAKRDKEAEKPSADKCQCLLCGKFYVQVGSHVHQVHKMTCREYREHFELEVKAGVTPAWYHKLKGDQARENETFKNLEKGAKFRFKPGQKGVGVYKRSPITIEKLLKNKPSRKH